MTIGYCEWNPERGLRSFRSFINAWIVSKRGKAETQLGDCDMWVLPFLSLYCKLNNALKVSNKFGTLIWTHMFTIYEHVKTCKPNFLCAVRTLNFTVDPWMEKYNLNFLSFDKKEFLISTSKQKPNFSLEDMPRWSCWGSLFLYKNAIFGMTHCNEFSHLYCPRAHDGRYSCFDTYEFSMWVPTLLYSLIRSTF